MGDQQNYYRENEEYANFLEGWDPGFYAKYADTALPGRARRKGARRRLRRGPGSFSV